MIEIDMRNKLAFIAFILIIGAACKKPPTSPTQLFSVKTEVSTAGYAEGLVADSVYLYVATGEAGLTVIDLSDFPSMSVVGRWDGAPPSDDYSYAVHKFEDDTLNRVYLANGDGNLKVIDVSDPENPTFLTDGFWAHNCEDVYGFTRADTQFLLIARRDWGVAVTQVGVDGSLIQRGAWISVPGYTRGVFYADSTLFVANGQDGVQVFDLTNIDNPVKIAEFDTPGNARKVFADPPFIYVADWHGGLVIGEMQPDSTIRLVAKADVDGVAKDVVVKDGFCYVASGNGGVFIFDVSHPDEPVFVQQVTGIGNALSIIPYRDCVLVGTRYGVYTISMN